MKKTLKTVDAGTQETVDVDVVATFELFEKAIVAQQTAIAKANVTIAELTQRVQVLENGDVRANDTVVRLRQYRPSFDLSTDTPFEDLLRGDVPVSAPKLSSPRKATAKHVGTRPASVRRVMGTAGTFDAVIDSTVDAIRLGRKRNHFNVKIHEAALAQGRDNDPRVYLDTRANRAFKSAAREAGIPFVDAVAMLTDRV